MNAADLTLKDFLAQLAAKQPTPGGGSASALGGALGAALANMAANYTIGNEKYALFDAEARVINDELNSLRAKLIELADLDMAAYQSYRDAVALPKNTPEEKSIRTKASTSAKEIATKVPGQILSAAHAGLRATERLSRAVNPNLAGDVASAAYFFEACARGASIQVVSNCAAGDEQGHNAAQRKLAAAKIAECQSLREKIDAQVLKLLGINA